MGYVAPSRLRKREETRAQREDVRRARIAQWGSPRKLPWHEARFIEDPDKTRTECRNCGRAMWLPQSKLRNNMHCTAACATDGRAKERKEGRAIARAILASNLKATANREED